MMNHSIVAWFNSVSKLITVHIICIFLKQLTINSINSSCFPIFCVMIRQYYILLTLLYGSSKDRFSMDTWKAFPDFSHHSKPPKWGLFSLSNSRPITVNFNLIFQTKRRTTSQPISIICVTLWSVTDIQ